MANGKNPINYSEYKNLKADEKNLFQFEAFQKMHNLYDLMNKKYAKKWVEKVMVAILGTVGLAVLGAVIGTVVIAGG